MDTDGHGCGDGTGCEPEQIDDVTRRVIGCAFAVANTLGSGFLEKVYENALAHELRKVGFTVEQQKKTQVTCDDVVVGDYVADIVVEERLLLEIKAAKSLDRVHFAQALNYLKATGLRIALLMNFGSPRIQVRRILND